MLDGDWIAATVDGNYGTYQTRVQVRRNDKAVPFKNCSCTCPSDDFPCKHALALAKTWRVNRASFDDLGPKWKILSERSKDDLIGLIRAIGAVHPQALRYALGLSEKIQETPEDLQEQGERPRSRRPHRDLLSL